MILAGFQKLSLLDYPWKISCILFTGGCNFRCRFCHNPELVLPQHLPNTQYSRRIRVELLDYLRSRQGIIDGVSITGGEPTLHSDLPDLLHEIKSLWYAIKLDTNGKNPKMLDLLLSEWLVDCIAMDLKHTWNKYEALTGIPTIDIAPYQTSVALIREKAPDYEFRTTVIKWSHTPYDIEDIARYIIGAKSYVLQNYRPKDHLDPSFLWSSFSMDELYELQSLALLSVEKCDIRF